MSSWFDLFFNIFGSKTPDNSSNFSVNNYAPKKHLFTVETSEGEVCELDTADRSSPFYGESWTKILDAYEKKDFLRGRVIVRSTSRDNRFSGYVVKIEGVEAFLPASKSAWFYNPERDASGKFIAVSIENIYTSGSKVGKLVVNAYEPLRFLMRKQSRKSYITGAFPYAIAMDYDNNNLIFPHFKDQVIYVPLDHAAAIAQNRGLGYNPDNFTGWCWQLQIINWQKNLCFAKPLDVLTD